MKKICTIFLVLMFLANGIAFAKTNKKEVKPMEKIVQTAGRDKLGDFAPEFAHFNDDVLFGENWNNKDIDLKTRSIIKKSRCCKNRNGWNNNSLRILHGLAKSMGNFQSCKRSLG